MTETKRAAARALATAYVVILAALLAFGWLLTHPWERVVDPREDRFMIWLAERRTGEVDSIAAAGSRLADTWVGIAVALVLAALLGLWWRSWLPLVYLTVLMAGHHSMYVVATALLSRDRPPVLVLDPGLVPDHSYPSGHTATAVVLYAGTAVLLARNVPALRRWVWPLFLVAPVVAWARLQQGAHHPTDVLAALLYGAAWVAVVSRVLLSRRTPGRPAAAAGGGG